MNSFRVDKYSDALRTLPASGGGGCHTALLSVANLGAIAKLSPEQVVIDLRQHVHGSRPVPEREIRQAVDKAFSTVTTRTTWTPRPRPRVREDALQSIIRRGDGADAAILWEESPIHMDWPHSEDSWRVLSMLYEPDEFLFIGDDQTPGVIGESIRTAAQWIEIFQMHKCAFPKIIPNPLSGEPGLTKSGKQSFRADSCIASFRFIVCEFDGIPLDQQFAFWFACPHLPVAAITHSGKKSLHAWIRADAASADEWTREVENKLFAQYLKPLGLDASCKNEARLSRMPGHVRADTGLPQTLLYLAPTGKAVCS